MNDERDKILKLLEDGKITADQAARLIEALGTKRSEFELPPVPPIPRMHRMRSHMFREMDRIPDMVADAVSSAMRSGFEARGEGRKEFAGAHDMDVRTVSGDIEVSGWDKEIVSVSYSEGGVKAIEADGGVQVRSVSGDIEASVPRKGTLDLETVSGDIEVEAESEKAVFRTVSGDVTLRGGAGSASLHTTSGDIELNGVSGVLEVDTKSGDVEIEAAGPVEGKVETKSGDITITLGEEADVALMLWCEEGGDIDISGQAEVVEQGEGSAKVKFGSGSRVMEVRTRSGDITVRTTREA